MHVQATRILQYSGRPLDQYARVAATEAAAHTANYIFYQVCTSSKYTAKWQLTST